MTRKHLKREPQHRRGADDWWWYEQNDGICVVVEMFDEGLERRVGSRQVTIPWTRIRAALKRKDKP